MRVEYPGAIYHVMDRGDRREDISNRSGVPVGCKLARPKGLSPCFIIWPVNTTIADPRGLTNHAHNWNSNLRLDPFTFMSNLRTKGRENVGWGYTNQPGGGERG